MALGVLPFLALAAIVAADLAAGPQAGFLPLLAVAPALAAIATSAGVTALIGGLALALAAVLAAFNNIVGSQRESNALVTIALVTAAAVVASAIRRRREKSLADVSAVNQVVQRVVLRPVPARLRQLRLAARYISASARAQIGGDLYAVVPTDGKVRLILGDVQGKGLDAVQTAATVLGAFREAVWDAPDLVALAARVELSLEREHAQTSFVTAVLAEIPDAGTGIEILNCGHPPPLLLRARDTTFLEPTEAGLPLGLPGLSAGRRQAHTARFVSGDRIVFYTDGISEARNKSGDFYQLDRCLEVFGDLAPEAALERLSEDVIRYVGHELDDDAALLLVSKSGPAGHSSG